MTMVLVDTSLWVGHFRRANPVLQTLLETGQVLCHPLIVLELAFGAAPALRERTLGDLKVLRQAVAATPEETLALLAKEQLYDSDCGAVDVALLASVKLTPASLLWTADNGLRVLSARLGVACIPAHAGKSRRRPQ